MPARIGPRRPRRLYVREWRESRGLTQEVLAKRLETTGTTVHRWETGQSALNTTVMAALADALSIEPEDLYHHPDKPTPNALLRGEPADIQSQAITIIEALRKSRA